MEVHRLKPMPEGYDQELFNEIYRDTRTLRKKLAYNIDHRRFGVEKEDIDSWFDIKFIYVFQKYYNQFIGKPGVLKGHIINSLQLFRYRILKEAYMPKNEQFRNKIEITEIEYFEDLISVTPEDPGVELQDERLTAIRDFLKSQMSDNAYLIFELQLNPPPFILYRLESLGNQRSGNIPNDLLADYLGFIPSPKVINYISDLKREVKSTVEAAREYFKSPSLSVESMPQQGKVVN